MKSTVLAVFVVLGCRDATTSVASCDPPIAASDRPLLEVQFTEQMRIRGCSLASLHSESGTLLLGLQATLRNSGVVKVQPMFDSVAVAVLVRDAQRLHPGEPIFDLLSWHFLALAPGTDTTAALAALRARPEIQYAYVHSEVIPPPP
jgi:hypothetical protein